ncbi:unnamed protein product, partial [Musa hybrid cultivar]
ASFSSDDLRDHVGHASNGAGEREGRGRPPPGGRPDIPLLQPAAHDHRRQHRGTATRTHSSPWASPTGTRYSRWRTREIGPSWTTPSSPSWGSCRRSSAQHGMYSPSTATWVWTGAQHRDCRAPQRTTLVAVVMLLVPYGRAAMLVLPLPCE